MNLAAPNREREESRHLAAQTEVVPVYPAGTGPTPFFSVESATPGWSDRPASNGSAQDPGKDTHQSAQAKVQTDKPSGLEWAFEEFRRQLDSGSELDADRYCEQYPNFRASLRRLIEDYRHLEKSRDSRNVPWPKANENFLGFFLIRQLGRGAFGRVFLAREPALGDRQVAVKVSLHGAREAEMLGRLEHANVVPVHSVRLDPATGLSAVCMPYLGDRTLCDLLDRVLSRRPAPFDAAVIGEVLAGGSEQASYDPRFANYVDEVTHLGIQLAEGLAFIHSRGIFHRDLKPSNVLLSFDGRPMLLDFNLSLDAITCQDRVGGTLPYMSPEQLQAIDPEHREKLALVDGRSDVYSLGVMLYELLAGTHPFGPIPLRGTRREIRELLLERQAQGPPPIRERNARVDRGLAHVLDRVLAFDLPRRLTSAAELAVALRKALSRSRRLRRWLATHPRLALTSLMLGVGTSLMGGYTVAAQDPPGKQELLQGQHAYRDEKYSVAEKHFARAVEAGETHQGYTGLGRTHMKMGKLAIALADFEKADPKSEDPLVSSLRGFCLCANYQFDAAIVHFQKAIEAGPVPAEVYNDLGYAYLERSIQDKAKDPLDKAIELDPGFRMAYYNRAVWCSKQLWDPSPEVPVRGLEDIQKALELGPGNANIYRMAARLSVMAARRIMLRESLGLPGGGLPANALAENLTVDSLMESARKNFRLALEHGLNIEYVKGDVHLKQLLVEPQIQEWLKQPNAPLPTPPLDPGLVELDLE